MRKILLVEDNRTMLAFTERVLSRKGFEVITAVNGAQALEILNQNEEIQFVLSDWVMPEMDGIELCRRVKSSNFSRYLFFMLLSGNDDQEAIIDGINAGADGFVGKEIHVGELIARIKAGFRILELHNELTRKNKQLDEAYASMNKDLASAGEMLKRLLPREKKLSGIELSYVSIPNAHLGGDMLGYMKLDDEHVAFYLLDVAGHGVPSALMSFSVQQSMSTVSGNGSIVRTAIPTSPYYRINSPHEVLQQLNTLYQAEQDDFLYFTMVYIVLNVKTGLLSYSVAGHPPMVWLHRESGDAEFIGQESFVVGAFDFANYQTAHIQLVPGDKIWLYSDGITEAEQGKNLFTEERFRQTVLEVKDYPTSLQAESLVCKVKEWQKTEHFNDDISVLLVEWTGFTEGDKTCNTKLSTKINAQFLN